MVENNNGKHLVKDYFQNLIYYNNKRRLVPLILLSVIMGMIFQKCIETYKAFIWMEFLYVLVINFILLIVYIVEKPFDNLRDNNTFKVIFWAVNLSAYSLILCTNYESFNNMFKNIEIAYLPKEIYSIIVPSIVFILFTWLINLLLFNNIKSTKITTSGLEIEVDNSPLVNKQNEIINNMEKAIVKSAELSSKMDIIISDFIIEKVIDENNDIKESYNIDELFICLRQIMGELFKSYPEVKVDFKTINNINEIKNEYNIPNNVYNSIMAKINDFSQGINSIFNEKNILFINFKTISLDYGETLPHNMIICIIEFTNEKQAYNVYGSLIIDLLKIFDYTMSLQLVPLIKEEE